MGRKGEVTRQSGLLRGVEALTPTGFVDVEKLDIGVPLFSIGVGGVGYWSGLVKLDRYSYKGLVVSLDSRSLSLSCTRDHPIATYSGKLTHRVAGTLPKNFTTWSSGRASNYAEVEPKRELELRLAAWFCTDSYFSSYDAVYLYQRESNAYKIRELLDYLGIPYKEKNRFRDIKQICGKILKKSPEALVTFTMSRLVANSVGVYNNHRLPDLCRGLSFNEWDIFLDTLVEADGTLPTGYVNSRVVYGSKEFCDSVQAVAVTKGWSASLTEYREGHWRVNLNKRQTRKQSCETQLVEYSGPVTSIHVSSGNLLVRVSNKCHFTGNSV